MGKGEIARYEQFLLFPQCFQKTCFPGCQKVSLCGDGLSKIFHLFISSVYDKYEFNSDKDKPFNEFLMGTVNKFDETDKDDGSCKKAFEPILTNLHTRFSKEYTLSHNEVDPCVRVIEVFSCHRLLAEVSRYFACFRWRPQVRVALYSLFFCFFFTGVFMSKTFQRPSLVLMKPRQCMNS